MIKNVIFDFGNVLAAFDPRAISRKYAETDTDADALAAVIFDDRWAALDGGRISYEDYIRDSLARLPERLHGAACRLFDGWCADLVPIEATAHLIDVLRARGYRLYILSSAPECFSASARENYPFTALFDGEVYSAVLHMEKPNADIYRYLLEKYDLCADECFFLDDKPVNVEGAAACGIRGTVYDGDGEKALAAIEALAGTGIVSRGCVARRNFLGGRNCAQSVLLAFSDVTGLDRDTSMRLASSFGGGMGRMREVCGAVSGALMVLGLVHGYDADAPTAKEDKAAHYAHVQEFAARFRDKQESIVCREILARRAERLKAEAGDDEQTLAMLSDAPTPTPRSEEYYHKRPCGEVVALAAELLDEYLKELATGSIE